MTHRINIAVVILNWNGRNFLEKFLPDVIKHSQEIAEVIVADNASSDDSIEFLNKNYPDIRIIRNSENGGFAKGYNDALKKVDAEYYILLNSDIEVTENWIQPVIELMDSDPLIAACQPKLLDYKQRNKFEYAGSSGGYIDFLGYPFCRGRIFQELETDSGQYDDEREVFWATGACLFVKAKLYHEFGGLDNDFFAHMEEIDFCWRLKSSGYKIMVQPKSVVYHVGGGTLPKNNSKKTFLNFRNNMYLLLKNLPTKQLPLVFFLRFFMDGIAAAKFLLSGQHKDCAAVIKAHLAFLAKIPLLLRKRRANKISPNAHIYSKNIVIQHYVKKISRFSDLSPDDFS